MVDYNKLFLDDIDAELEGIIDTVNEIRRQGIPFTADIRRLCDKIDDEYDTIVSSKISAEEEEE